MVWSIYIRCSTKQALVKTHIPALEAIVGKPATGAKWLIESEKDTPGQFRLLTRQPVSTVDPYDAVVEFQKRLYQLAPSWETTGRLDQNHPHGIYLMARHSRKNPGHTPPAIVDVLAEFQADLGKLSKLEN